MWESWWIMVAATARIVSSRRDRADRRVRSLLSGPEPLAMIQPSRATSCPLPGAESLLMEIFQPGNEDGFVNEKTALCSPYWSQGLGSLTSQKELGRNLAKKEKKHGLWIWSNLVLQLLIYRKYKEHSKVSENLTMRSTGKQIIHFFPQKGMGGTIGGLWHGNVLLWAPVQTSCYKMILRWWDTWTLPGGRSRCGDGIIETYVLKCSWIKKKIFK